VPSMMIHLLAAHKLCADTEPLFCIGTVAPDAVRSREEKDITHFRTAKNRERALVELAEKTKKDSPFEEGVLLHLFLDWRWDNKAYKNYSVTHDEENWFYTYRHEIALAGAYIYHNCDWSREVWQGMLECPESMYGKTPGVCDREVTEFLKRNYRWHEENNIGPSEAYSPEFVEDFTNRTVVEFFNWRKGIILNASENTGA